MELFGDALREATRLAREAAPSPVKLGGLSDDDLLLFVAQAEELGRVADALRLAGAGEVGERSRKELGEERLSARRGCISPAEMLERLTLVSGATARVRLKSAFGLRPRTSITGEEMPPQFPRVAAAVAAGDLGLDAVAAIVGALAPIRKRLGASDDMDAAEEALVEAAYGSDSQLPAAADELKIMAQTWALYLDPDGSLPDEEGAVALRGLGHGRMRNGVVPWRGDLLPEVSAQLDLLLDAFNNPSVHAAPGPVFTPSDSNDDVPDPRTARQRNHDALGGILGIAAGLPGMPLLGGAPPTLVVTVSADQLDKPRGVAFVPTHDAGDPGAVATSVARHAACLGRIQKVMFGEDGRILELGTADRTFTGQRRKAIATRDGECIIPGCHVPAAWTEVHHVKEYARGGPTHTDNGVLLCWWHHRTIETSGWEILMRDGVPWVRAPRWIDPERTWRPTRGSPARQLMAMAAAPPG